MIKNAVQHQEEIDLSIAVVKLNTMIRYMFSEQYRILNRSTYRRRDFHLGNFIFKKQFLSVNCKIKSCMEKNKEGKTRRIECANQVEGMQRSHAQKNNKAHSLKTFHD